MRALVDTLRATPVGRQVRLPDGTVIKSVPVRHGATHTRRFAVSRGGRQPMPRVGSLTNTVANAAEAAAVALRRSK